MPPLLYREAEAGGHRGTGRALRAPLRSAQGTLVTTTGERRQALLQAKLSAIVDHHWGSQPSVAGTFPSGATLRRGHSAWVLSEEPGRLLGGAMAWASSIGVENLHVMTETGTGSLARRAAAFARPPKVWVLEGRGLKAAAPAAMEPEVPVAPGAADLASLIAGAGADVVVEHGRLLGEVLGLEVARVEVNDGRTELVIGVGRHDREARRLLQGAGPSGPNAAGLASELARVVADVRGRRIHAAPSHPAYYLAPERWLRAIVMARPELIGARGLEALAPPTPPPDLLVRSPAPTVGTDGDGAALVAVCSTGVDPELIPTAVDARTAAAQAQPGRGSFRLAIVVPTGDDHRVTRTLARALIDPADVRTVSSAWRALAS